MASPARTSDGHIQLEWLLRLNHRDQTDSGKAAMGNLDSAHSKIYLVYTPNRSVNTRKALQTQGALP